LIKSLESIQFKRFIDQLNMTIKERAIWWIKNGDYLESISWNFSCQSAELLRLSESVENNFLPYYQSSSPGSYPM
jgi:predicted phosphatase